MFERVGDVCAHRAAAVTLTAAAFKLHTKLECSGEVDGEGTDCDPSPSPTPTHVRYHWKAPGIMWPI